MSVAEVPLAPSSATIDTGTNRIFSIANCEVPNIEHVCTDLVAATSADADRKQIIEVFALV